IVEFYTDFYNRTMGRKIKGITSEVREKFMAYSWPGNVRELRNMIEGGFNLCEGEYLDIGDLDVYSLRALDRMAAKPSDQIEAESESLKDKVRNFERKLIINTLQESENISKAAEKLGITRQTLSNKMRELKIQDAEFHREG
ncbi:MAG: transcriptional regulator, partial [Firmicutes bacterium]|nr:transcriptional regulator [Bacillota bacterium]